VAARFRGRVLRRAGSAARGCADRTAPAGRALELRHQDRRSPAGLCRADRAADSGDREHPMSAVENAERGSSGAMKIRLITMMLVDPETSNVSADSAHPGLAVSIIGTILKNAGYDVSIYVDAIQPAPWEALAESDLVAFTVNTACFRESYHLA